MLSGAIKPKPKFTCSINGAGIFTLSDTFTVSHDFSLSSIQPFFTAWRSTLDLLERMLARHGIQCRRIDGRVSISDRTQRLSEFQFDPDNNIPVLLLSIETGAVGLTLTAADRVHIVEPQWNPSVEQQAIGRALRIGQTRKVTIVKYIVQNTVEENIVALQKKKSGLAKFSLDSRAEDTQNEGLDDLKFVLDN
ncbi:hypothetical protein LRP88_11048 [Fusarium phalaenopsidis]